VAEPLATPDDPESEGGSDHEQMIGTLWRGLYELAADDDRRSRTQFNSGTHHRLLAQCLRSTWALLERDRSYLS
jgi:hypothetical protein